METQTSRGRSREVSSFLESQTVGKDGRIARLTRIFKVLKIFRRYDSKLNYTLVLIHRYTVLEMNPNTGYGLGVFYFSPHYDKMPI